MRRIAALVLLTVLVGAQAPPAAAKGPWRITVRGPGISGEVDVFEEPAVFGHRGPWSAGELIGDPLPSPRAHGPRYVVSWYAAMGGEPMTPLVDRVAFYPEAGTVQVLAWSGAFDVDGGGWHEAVSSAGRHLAGLVEELAAREAQGAPGYVFVVRDGNAAWKPIDTPALVRRALTAVLTLLA